MTDWQREWRRKVARRGGPVPPEDLMKWQRRATVEFYTQPKIICYYLHKWLTLRHADYYLRPFKNSLKSRLLCMLKGDFRLETL